MNNKKYSPSGESWSNYKKKTFTYKELAEIDAKIAKFGEKVNTKTNKENNDGIGTYFRESFPIQAMKK
ncbi:MAG: hypothetical protein LBT79_01310 [Elusimicrobiota bacterium]|jgi:hypothetical protein|nr:hypothetical protein [Elusimicrobiota bacterium]